MTSSACLAGLAEMGGGALATEGVGELPTQSLDGVVDEADRPGVVPDDSEREATVDGASVATAQPGRHMRQLAPSGTESFQSRALRADQEVT